MNLLIAKIFAKNKVTAIDKAMLAVATIHPLTAIPQVVEIYSNQSSANISLVTWLSFMLIGIVFLSYAVVHKITPMIINQVLWFAIDLAVVVGVLVYG